jgi:hypothetical protein
MSTIVTLVNLTVLVAVVGPIAVMAVGFSTWDRGSSGRRATLLAALAAVVTPTLLVAYGLLVQGRHGIVSLESGYGPLSSTAATARMLGLVTIGLGGAACVGLVVARGRGRRAAQVALAGAGVALCVMIGVSMWWVTSSAGVA